jgi:hypothetical protein
MQEGFSEIKPTLAATEYLNPTPADLLDQLRDFFVSA